MTSRHDKHLELVEELIARCHEQPGLVADKVSADGAMAAQILAITKAKNNAFVEIMAERGGVSGTEAAAIIATLEAAAIDMVLETNPKMIIGMALLNMEAEDEVAAALKRISA